MKPKALFATLTAAYAAGREFNHLPKASRKRLRRGTARSVAALAEDLVAAWVAGTDRRIEAIYIAKKIRRVTPKGLPKERQFEPDIMLLRNGQIDRMIDVKTDMGWFRNGAGDLADRHAAKAEACAGGIAEMTDDVPGSSMKQSYPFSADLTYDIVLVSGANTTARRLQAAREAVKRVGPRTSLFVLSSGAHPNRYDTASTLTIHHDEFDALASRLARRGSI